MSQDFFTEPPVTALIECPRCKEKIFYESEKCRFCNEAIDEDYALQSAIYLGVITQACSLANTIRTGKIGLLLILPSGLIAYFLDAKLLFLHSVLFVSILYSAAIIRWNYRYGDLEFPEDEFIQTQKEMRRYLHLCLGFITAEILLLTIVW